MRSASICAGAGCSTTLRRRRNAAATRPRCAALKRQADDLQHQLYTRLREIDVERERMLDDIAEKLSLTPDSTTLFTIRWSLA